MLVTGTTGCGKSTTLAAMVDFINRHRCTHVMTVEDPIEFLHRDQKSIVNQREVSVDTRSFAQALRSALRQDPDVILVGEMRDFETIETGLLAAETGHLVFSTLHTLDATETINRIIAVFPPHQQKQVRLQLASVLRAVISQRLMPRADGDGRAPAVEVMISTPFIRDCIVDKDKTHLIHGAIAAGTSQYGMQTFDQSIFGLFQTGLVSYEEALRWASNVDEFKLKVQGISTTVRSAAATRWRKGSSGARRRSRGSGRRHVLPASGSRALGSWRCRLPRPAQVHGWAGSRVARPKPLQSWPATIAGFGCFSSRIRSFSRFIESRAVFLPTNDMHCSPSCGARLCQSRRTSSKDLLAAAPREYVNFLNLATGSAAEDVVPLSVAHRLEFMSDQATSD